MWQALDAGSVKAITEQTPATQELVFTAGARVFRFQVEDSGGGVTAARTTVTVTEVTRTGIAARDHNLRSPEECTGAGRRDENDFLGTVGPG